MKVTVEEISPIKKKLLIEISQEEQAQKLERAYQKLQKKVALKGFRKGKVPRPILEQYYKGQTESEVLSDLVQESYVWALQDQKIEPVAPPQISDLKKEEASPISYWAEVEVRPRVVLKKYKELVLKKSSEEVSEKEIAQEMESLRQAHAQLTPLSEESALQSGHVAVVDFKGLVEGEAFVGSEAKGVMIDVGAGRFLQDFEQGLLGMKKGEQKKIKVDFPKDYPSAELAGKKADFEITLHDLKEKVLPELNDDFARDLGNFESLEQIRNKIKENMAHRKTHQAREALYRQILDFLIQEHPFEVPESMLAQELEAMLENAKRQLQQQKLTLEQTGMTVETFKNQNREAALGRVKSLLLFEAIAEAEQIKVTPEEMATRIQTLANSMGQKPEVVQHYYREQNLYPVLVTQILEKKVLDFLISQSEIQ